MLLFRIAKRSALPAALVAILAVVPDWAAGQGQREECRDLWTKLQAAAKAGDLKAAAAGEEEISVDPICNSLGVAAKEVVLDAYREQDARLERAGTPPAQRLAHLNASLRYRNAWNAWDIFVKIGDLRRRTPDANGQLDNAGISLAYDQAVRAIDAAPSSAQPPAAVIKRVVGLAYQFEALSPTALPTRGGMTRAARQVNVQRTPVPLQFVYNKDQLTEAGQVQAENLLKLLKEQNMPRLHLVGHTDPVGSDDYNDRLSIQRAIAIKSFLVAHGYPSDRLTTEGRGKREMLNIEDKTAFTEDQIHQMLRRVELVWEQ